MIEREMPTLESLENRQNILARLMWKRLQLWDQEKQSGLIGTGGVNVQTLEGAIKLGRMRLMNNEKLVQVREMLGQVRHEIDTVKIPQLIEQARAYIGELALDEVRLEQIRKYVEVDEVLTADVLQAHQARYDRKRVLANEDPDLKRGLGLLKEQKVAELLSQLAPQPQPGSQEIVTRFQPVVDVELTPEGEIANYQSKVGDELEKSEKRKKSMVQTIPPVLDISLPPLSTVVPSEDIEVITIEYQPRPDEIRTRDETIVLKVIIESLGKSAKLWVNLLADEIATLRTKDSLAGSEMGSYELTADKLKYDFEIGYRKMINEAEVDELRLRWELKDEELWESIQHLETTIIKAKDDSEFIRRVKSALTMASNDWKEQHGGREFRRII